MEKIQHNEDLIKAVRPYVSLYNKANTSHADDVKNQRLWERIAAEIGAEDVEEVKKEWRYLRNQYTKKRKASGITGSSGDGGDEAAVTETWAHLNSMRFLDPYMKGRG